MIGVYVHIPFCISKCAYCDFPSYSGCESLYEEYIQAVCREIETYQGERHADTIYFGGGTPSLLPVALLEKVLVCLRHQFIVSEDAEITVEANPDSLTLDMCRQLATIGVNRLSVGVQSFQDDVLRHLGRPHTGKMAYQLLEGIPKTGITNISLDLMYGLPEQTVEMFQQDIEMIPTIPVTHASIYSLIVEEHTLLYRQVQQGSILLPMEETVEQMKTILFSKMAEWGFYHYEISSYAKENYESIHNSKYWKYLPYIGFGAAAHSFDGRRRWENVRSIAQYIRYSNQDKCIFHQFEVSPQQGMEDFCYLALRMQRGISYQAFYKQFQTNIEDEFGKEIERLCTQGLLEKTQDGVCLSDLGLAYGNYVFSQFIRVSS